MVAKLYLHRIQMKVLRVQFFYANFSWSKLKVNKCKVTAQKMQQKVQQKNLLSNKK